MRECEKLLDKKIVYWGIGNICRQCLEACPEIVPEFYIDSFAAGGMMRGKEVKYPNCINDWEKYFVVITTTSYKQIERILETKNLIKNINFIDYKKFFGIDEVTVTNSITEIRDYCSERMQCPRILIVAPIFTARNTYTLVNFFKKYIQLNSKYDFIVVSSLEALSSEKAGSMLEHKVFDMPRICKWNGTDNEVLAQMDDKVILNEKENDFVRQLESIKYKEDESISYKNTKEEYYYFKKMVEVVNPEKMIIWGNWTRRSFILREIAAKNRIIYGVMEHGWIPGTIQFDPLGIAGQSVYTLFPEKLNDIYVENKNIEEIKTIKEYITRRQLDTGIFEENSKDEIALRRLDPTKKTVFLVGMDERGMGINPQSHFWENYISSIYRSMQQILDDLMDICSMHDWNLIYKPHPGNRLENAEDYIENNLILIREKSIDTLISISDVVVSMSSAVEYKALMYRKPVVQVGITGLSKKGCTYEVNERRDIEKAITSAIELGMTDLQVRNYDIFLAKLLKRYLWDDLSDKDFSYGLTFKNDFFECVQKEIDNENSCICTY